MSLKMDKGQIVTERAKMQSCSYVSDTLTFIFKLYYIYIEQKMMHLALFTIFFFI